MSYRYYRFGASMLIPAYNISQNIGTGSVRLDSVDAPRGGAFDSLGREQAFRGGYAVQAQGILIGHDSLIEEGHVIDHLRNLKTQFDDLRSYLGRREKLWRIDYDGNLQWAWARLTNISVTKEVVHRQYLELSLDFYIYSALWHGELHGSWRLDDGNALDDDLVMDMDLIIPLTNTSTNITLNNAGNGVLRDFEFAITPAGTPITKILIEVPLKTSLLWTGSIAVGTQLVIDFGAMGISNNGVNAYSGLALTANHKIDDWMRLDPGSNTITVTRTGGNSSSKLAVVYYDGWI